jgi:hypothetical protein
MPRSQFKLSAALAGAAVLATAFSAVAAPFAPLPPSTPSVVLAQFGPGGAIDPNRDCQTIRRCNFSRGGTYRGCISAYSCRRCTLVPSKCTVTGREQVCREVRCTW